MQFQKYYAILSIRKIGISIPTAEGKNHFKKLSFIRIDKNSVRPTKQLYVNRNFYVFFAMKKHCKYIIFLFIVL